MKNLLTLALAVILSPVFAFAAHEAAAPADAATAPAAEEAKEETKEAAK
jgi:hypothetical protein